MFTSTIGESEMLPVGARQVKGKAGRDIPLIMVTSADGSVGIEGIPASILKEDMRGAVKSLKETLKTANVLGAKSLTETPTLDPETTEPSLFAEAQQWTNSDGKPITASIKKVDGGIVQFIMTDGRALDYPLIDLSADSQKKISEIQAD